MTHAASRTPAAAPREERQVLSEYLVRQGLKRSDQREAILDAFLRRSSTSRSTTCCASSKRRDPQVGRTTIYRTLKLLQEAGLASELLARRRGALRADY